MVVVAVGAPRLSVTAAFTPPFDRSRNTLLVPLLYDMTPLESPTFADNSERIFSWLIEEPCVEESPVKIAVLDPNTCFWLYVVVAPMLLISERIDWYSWFAAVACELLRVPFETSVASVTARLSRFVTCERAPSATVNRPTPSVALVCDCARAVALAWRPLTSERPAASSAPELIFEPEDSCCRVLLRLLFVLFRLLAADIADRLFKTPRDMGSPLSMHEFAVPFAEWAPKCFSSLGSCLRAVAVASCPFFGLRPCDFISSRRVSPFATLSAPLPYVFILLLLRVDNSTEGVRHDRADPAQRKSHGD